MKILLNFIFLILLFFTDCATYNKQPSWILKPPESTREVFYFVGRSVGEHQRYKDALYSAFMNGAKEATAMLEIKITAECEQKIQEKNGEISSEVYNHIRSSAKATIKGMKVKEKWVKKYQDNEGNYYYDIACLFQWPRKRYIEAMNKLEAYRDSTVKIAERRYQKGIRDKDIEPFEAYRNYQEALHLLNKIPYNYGIDLRSQIRIDLQSVIDNPKVHLAELGSNGEFIEKVEPLNYEMQPLKYHLIEAGKRMKLRINLKRSCYLYVFGYDKTNNRMFLLYPNKYESDNFVGTGMFICPSEEDLWIIAKLVEPLASVGPEYNIMKVVASTEKLMEFDFGEKIYLELNDDQLRQFLSHLESSHAWDSKTLEFWIKE